MAPLPSAFSGPRPLLAPGPPPPQTTAREFASRTVTCNAVAPGFIASDMTAAIDKKYEETILKGIPLGERRAGWHAPPSSQLAPSLLLAKHPARCR